jgi:hypothetical protein
MIKVSTEMTDVFSIAGATLAGTGEAKAGWYTVRVQPAMPILWRAQVTLGRRNARKAMGVLDTTLKVRAIPQETVILYGRT